VAELVSVAMSFGFFSMMISIGMLTQNDYIMHRVEWAT